MSSHHHFFQTEFLESVWKITAEFKQSSRIVSEFILENMVVSASVLAESLKALRLLALRQAGNRYRKLTRWVGLSQRWVPANSAPGVEIFRSMKFMFTSSVKFRSEIQKFWLVFYFLCVFMRFFPLRFS